MYEKGDYVVYGQNGICQVQDVTELQMPGTEKSRSYYVLIPKINESNTIYIPVDNDKLTIRKILTVEEAKQLRGEIAQLEPLEISTEKMRELAYKTAFRSCDCRLWARLVKTIYLRRQERQAQGRRMTSTDERYLHQAEECLYQELALVLELDKKELQECIEAEIMKLLTA